MLLLFTIAHPLVDACSLSVLIAGGMSWRRVIAYNAMAFALQLPMGLVADARPGLVKGGFILGVAMTIGAAMSAVAGFGGWPLLAAACVGNALFHLTAGKDVLDSHGGRGGPIGLFISTGALGLLAGRLGMERCAAVALPGFAVALAVVAAATAVRWRARAALGVLPPALRATPLSEGGGEGNAATPLSEGGGEENAATPLSEGGGEENAAGSFSDGVGKAARRDAAPPPEVLWEVTAMAGLFLLVAWRSWAGLAAVRISTGQGMALLLVGAAVTWCGKAVGGYLAERIGRGSVTAASVCGSAALAFLCPPDNAAAWMALLFVAQLATGPVLSLLYDRTGCRGGMAFGLNCLGLFTGSL